MQKFVLFIFVCASLTSCKKEEAAFPYNEIERFSITAPDGSLLKASINNNEIIIYWPPLISMPDSISPQIDVSDRASVEPVSGTKVPFKDGVSFRVTAQNGIVQTYTLRAGSNQPVPVFDVSSSEFLRIDRNLDLSGEYFIRDTTKTKLFMTDKNGLATQLPGSSFISFYSARISAPIPFSIDTGYYSVKLITGVHTMVRGPFYIARPYLTEVTPMDAAKQLKPGDISVIKYAGLAAKYYHNSFTGATITVTVQTSAGRELITIPITKPENGTLNFVIPNNAPGKIIHLLINDADNNYLYMWEAASGTEIEIIE